VYASKRAIERRLLRQSRVGIGSFSDGCRWIVRCTQWADKRKYGGFDLRIYDDTFSLFYCASVFQHDPAVLEIQLAPAANSKSGRVRRGLFSRRGGIPLSNQQNPVGSFSLPVVGRLVVSSFGYLRDGFGALFLEVIHQARHQE